jgi:restriction endonuclease S subunit
MSALNKATVSSLPIHVVPLALQQQILAIQDVADQEINVLDQLKTNRQQMLKALFKTLLEK